jgi:prepilin-type N-terminal cleavage/methylation domain-containing protein/prepilin-type processing-associated H-X9-DG protein
MKSTRRAFTVLELLVVLAISGVLIGILIPAVMMVRESASRLQCANNLHQIGIALHSSHDINHCFPSGGWGWSWVGMPDRGSGPDQPGSWIYNALSFVEQGNLRGLGAGQGSPEFEHSIATLLATPVPLFNCPSRRAGGPYAVLAEYNAFKVGINRTGGTTVLTTARMARGDYAANAGSQPSSEIFAGPLTLAQGDSRSYRWPSTATCTGVFFQRSAVSLSQITRGTSNAFLVGERYIDVSHYNDGVDIGDNEGMYVGFDNDGYRITAKPPRRDRAGESNPELFGSAHPGGVNMLYCDGAVRPVNYNIDPAVFLDAGRRAD